MKVYSKDDLMNGMPNFNGGDDDDDEDEEDDEDLTPFKVSLLEILSMLVSLSLKYI